MRNSKQIFLFVAMAFAVLFAQAKDVIGNRELKKDSRSVAAFQQINVNADFDIIIDYAITPKVEVEAESNLLEVIVTEVKGKALNIGIAKKTKIVNNFPMEIVVLPICKENWERSPSSGFITSVHFSIFASTSLSFPFTVSMRVLIATRILAQRCSCSVFCSSSPLSADSGTPLKSAGTSSSTKL